MNQYLIIDIGTSSIRTAVVNEELQIEAVEQLKRTAAVVFDAEKEWETIREMMVRVTKDAKNISGIACSALLGWVGVDKDGNAVTPCYSYMHQCYEEYKEFTEAVDGETVYRINGRRVSPELAGFKVKYLKDKEPDVYEKLACFTSLKDFINVKLCGVQAIDHTSACYTMLYDLKNADWSGRLIDKLQIDAEKLPRLVRPYETLGTIKPELAKACGICDSIPVAGGSVDGSTGILGAGGINHGDAVSVMGTTDVFFMVQKDLALTEGQQLVTNPHVIPGLWLVGGPMGMYGGTLEWLLNNIMGGTKTLPEMNVLAEQVSPGADNLQFYPTLAGERTPFWNPLVKGTIIGMEQKHKAEHIFRAIMEGNAYAIRRIAEIGEENGISIEQVIAIGGGSKSDLWLQLKAEIMGKKYYRSDVQEATMMGTCILSMLASGKALDEIPKGQIIKEFDPAPERVEIYDTLYKKHMAIHKKLNNLYQD